MSSREVDNWLIWSIEHEAWWDADREGYVSKRRDAGRYSFAEARKLVRNANFGQDTPSEAMIAEEDS